MKLNYLDKREVLNAGIVALMSVSGTDLTPVEAARTSFHTFAEDYTEQANADLVDYLIRKRHDGPTEFPDCTFYIKVPLFVMQQILRHRIGISINQESLRYVEPSEDFYIPSREECKGKPKNAKQGTSNTLIEKPERVDILIRTQCGSAQHTYNELQKLGLANELCRTVLPTGQYTVAYIKFNMRSIFHFLGLRLEEHAQYQIRVYAEAMYEMIKPHFPVLCSAWENHVLNAVTFSADEWNAIKSALNFVDYEADTIYKSFEECCADRAKVQGMRDSRIREFMQKLEK